MAQGFSIGIYTEEVFSGIHQQMKQDVQQSSSDEQTKQERITALDMRFQEIDEIVHSEEMTNAMREIQKGLATYDPEGKGSSFSLDAYTENALDYVCEEIKERHPETESFQIQTEFDEMQKLVDGDFGKNIAKQGYEGMKLGIASVSESQETISEAEAFVQRQQEQQQKSDTQQTPNMSQTQEVQQESFMGNLGESMKDIFGSKAGMMNVGVGFGTAALTYKLTGSKVLGLAAGVVLPVVLEKMQLLPNATRTVDDCVAKWKSVFDGSYVQEKQVKENILQEQAQNLEHLEGISKSVNGTLGNTLDQIGVNGVVDIRNQMASCGADMASSGVFEVTAQMDSNSLSSLRTMSTGTMSVLEQKVDSMANEDGILSEEFSKDVVAELKNLHDGYAAYSDAATEKLQELYGDNPEMLSQAQLGLEKVMVEQAGPLYDMMQSLDERYGLFEEKDLEYLNEHPIAGLQTYGEYTGLTVAESEPEKCADKETHVAKEDAVQQQQAEATGASHASVQREIPELPYAEPVQGAKAMNLSMEY